MFIGYGFNDNSVIQTLTSQQTFENARKDIWVVLLDEYRTYSAYYEALGFNTIFATTEEFLDYLGTFNDANIGEEIETERINLLRPYMVPNGIDELKTQRPIKEFFSGSAPDWCDILGNQIYKTHHLKNIIDSIYSKNNTLILGGPVTGKSTLLKQAANDSHDVGMKFYFDAISVERAEFLVKLIGNDIATIFIDNLYDNI